MRKTKNEVVWITKHDVENFTMHSNFRYIAKICYDSENFAIERNFLRIAKFQHCTSSWLLFPLLYSISSSFDSLHSRLAEIDKKPYEIDGNQPDFVMIRLT